MAASSQPLVHATGSPLSQSMKGASRRRAAPGSQSVAGALASGTHECYEQECDTVRAIESPPTKSVGAILVVNNAEQGHAHGLPNARRPNPSIEGTSTSGLRPLA